MGFHPKDDEIYSGAGTNLERKLNRVRSRRAHAALVFESDACVGTLDVSHRSSAGTTWHDR